jgi:ABC-type polysaccharide/polyol phosphate transport system ATPase subunit
LKNICTRILVLKDGDQIFVGEPSKGIEIYASNTVPNN